MGKAFPGAWQKATKDKEPRDTELLCGAQSLSSPSDMIDFKAARWKRFWVDASFDVDDVKRALEEARAVAVVVKLLVVHHIRDVVLV